MKKSILPALCISLCFLSCDFKSKPYLKHDMEFEKIAGDCSSQNTKVSIEANTIGERFVFQECLAANFNGEYTVQRKGDTVDVKIGEPPAGTQSLYKIVLDINTRPVYRFLTVNGNTMPVMVTRY